MTYNAEEVMFNRLRYHLRQSPHVVALMEILADPVQDTRDVAEYILANMMDIDNSEGRLLDVIGEIVGVARPPKQEENIFTLRQRGEALDHDNRTGFADDSDPDVTTGGYMGSLAGLESQSEPGALMSDEDFRFLIRQKAASFRTKMTRENLFFYLIAFGSKCKNDDEDVFEVVLDPFEYDDLGAWQKNYVITKGFKPAGIRTRFRAMMRNGDSI